MRYFTAPLLHSLPFLSANVTPVLGATPCASLTAPHVEGATVLNSTATMLYNVTGVQYEKGVTVCSFETYLTHGDAGDAVRILVWLPQAPTTPWNGRFQGTGGGGFIAGYFEAALGPATVNGYAAASTDGGVGRFGTSSDGWAAYDPQLRTNMGYLSFHEMTIVGKAVTREFYGTEPAYSYFTGCSMGGRHAHLLAQRYPHHYHGILSASAAVDWDKLGMQIMWPFFLQSNNATGFVGLCKLDAITNASVAACDGLGGGKESAFIPYPPDCDFKAATMVGQTVQCDDGTQATVSDYDAYIWDRSRLGPRDVHGDFLWYGLEYGASYSFQGAAPPSFLSLTSEWVRNFVLKQTDYNISTIDLEQYATLWTQSVAEYESSWGSNDPDLSPFHERGGKLLAWHGWSDERLPSLGAIRYWEQVKTALGERQINVDDVYRLFMAPGTPHCDWANGHDPGDLAILTDWVERRVEPEVLPEGRERAFGKNCRHPKKLSYSGTGEVRNVSSWDCV
ncbi:feruloyl esterase B [Xylariomycetidae sp. FL0641]|nr:feruloyl esterase B [Xylariomycetidae sp. FL0641]